MIRTGVSLGVLLACALVFGCATAPPPPQQTPVAVPSVLDTSTRAIGIGSPESLVSAIETLSNSTEGYSTTGLELSYVAYTMLKILYPLYLKPDYTILPPATSDYPRMFRDVMAGRFPTVGQSSASFLTLIIPPLSVLYSDDHTVADLALESLKHAEALNPGSVVPLYLIGLIDERRGDPEGALASYDRALSVAPSCYPAAIGKARIFITRKDFTGAESILSALSRQLPPSAEVLRLDAQSLFALGKSAEADRAITESLQLEPNNIEGNLLAAQIWESEKAYGKGIAAVSTVEKLAKPTPNLILLKARLYAGQGDPLRALDTLRQGAALFPDNQQIADAYGKALLEAGRTTEGSAYIVQNLKDNPDSVDSLKLLIDDAIKNRLWQKGAQYVEKLVRLDSSDSTFAQAYTIYRGLGDTAQALLYAQRLYTRHPNDGSYVVPYALTLAAAGKKSEARTVIARGIATLDDPNAVSELYYIRSTLDTGYTEKLADLQAALLSNLDNVPATVAIAQLYAASGDKEMAIRYLKQAASLSPDDQSIKSALAKLEQ